MCSVSLSPALEGNCVVVSVTSVVKCGRNWPVEMSFECKFKTN